MIVHRLKVMLGSLGIRALQDGCHTELKRGLRDTDIDFVYIRLAWSPPLLDSLLESKRPFKAIAIYYRALGIEYSQAQS